MPHVSVNVKSGASFPVEVWSIRVVCGDPERANHAILMTAIARTAKPISSRRCRFGFFFCGKRIILDVQVHDIDLRGYCDRS